MPDTTDRPELRRIKDFPSYSIDANGNVYRDGRDDPVAQTPNHSGYLTVHLSMAPRTARKSVHTLLLEAFVGPRPAGMQGCHLDGNKTRNVLPNLAWGTRAENEAHKLAHGTKAIGAKNGASRLSDDKVELIRRKKAAGRTKNWGAQELAKQFNVALSTVVRAAAGKHWTHLEKRV